MPVYEARLEFYALIVGIIVNVNAREDSLPWPNNGPPPIEDNQINVTWSCVLVCACNYT